MAVVTTTFSSAAGDLWASPTWVSTDPSWKLDVQLTNWVNAINDATKISIVHDPGDATSRAAGTTNIVRWLLRCRESDTASDYGFLFAGARADGETPINNSGSYFARTAGTSNNGYGSYQQNIVSGSAFPFYSMGTHACSFRTSYDAEGATPWFAFMSNNVNSGTNYGQLHFLCRLSTANMAAGSYYPSTGLGKWFYAVLNTSYSSTALPNFVTPNSSQNAPYVGVFGSAILRAPQPNSTRGDGYFFKLGAQYGDTHFLGEPTYDMLVSNGNTGTWGDTVIIESKTYTRAVGCLWVRIA
jgi:hypothetical protein